MTAESDEELSDLEEVERLKEYEAIDFPMIPSSSKQVLVATNASGDERPSHIPPEEAWEGNETT